MEKVNIKNNLKANINNLVKEQNYEVINVDQLFNKIDELKKNQSITMIVLIIFIIFLILIATIFIYRYLKKEITKPSLFIDKQISSSSFVYDKDSIKVPKDGYNYSINFWFNVKDYYDNYNYWRHILHNGNNNQLLEFQDWDELSYNINEQSPGIWLHPNKNVIRVAFTVEIVKDYCETNTNENSCDNKNYCNWDGLTCKNKEHAYIDLNHTSIDDKEAENIIEYIDMKI